ncbi:YhcB family protein [Candidatus Blochmannia ocreatus (nom. nud.)]|uniref:Z-ring associated protein G n=1 Tax=Candidatus Blochmannia ocreatus (nom. nud.) TaxID=251538 RepID=A0ABY4ST35_9ENTR|nr:YhcB family protein [Candidatus Blochmannia ocreatus]URJ25139.1 YhcB family protein [Candidatus Blochmannia ocreatus]
MVWVLALINLVIGIFIGITIMYYKTKYLLNNQKNLRNELQNNKTQLNAYKKELSQHFFNTIDLLNKIAENYRSLYDNVKKSANFFLPNAHMLNNIEEFSTQNIKHEKLPIETPLDYSDNIENTTENLNNK